MSVLKAFALGRDSSVILKVCNCSTTWKRWSFAVTSKFVTSQSLKLGKSVSQTEISKPAHYPQLRTAVSSRHRNECDVNDYTPKKILVYSCVNDTFGRNYMMTVLNFNVLLVIIVFLSYSKLREGYLKHQEDTTVIWWRNRNLEIGLVLLILCDYVVFSIWKKYPHWSIRHLWLHTGKGQKYVEISTHSLASQKQTIKVPLHNVSGVISRENKLLPAVLKLSGRSYYLLLHKTDAIFHEPKLFDSVIGLKRSSAKGDTKGQP